MDPINREDARDAIVNVSHTCDGGHGEPCRQCEVLLKARDAVAALPSVPVATVGVTREELVESLTATRNHWWGGCPVPDETRTYQEYQADAILALLKPVAVDVEAAVRESANTAPANELPSAYVTRILRAAKVLP